MHVAKTEGLGCWPAANRADSFHLASTFVLFFLPSKPTLSFSQETKTAGLLSVPSGYLEPTHFLVFVDYIEEPWPPLSLQYRAECIFTPKGRGLLA